MELINMNGIATTSKHTSLCAVLIFIMSLTFNHGHAYEVHSINRAEILNGGDISCLLQDHNGYLWIGTHNGLKFYDGYSVIQVDEERRATLRNGKLTVLSLQEDRNNNLWVGTYAGYQLYDEQRNWIDANQRLSSMGFPSDKSNILHVDNEGNLYMVTADSLYKYHFDNSQILKLALPRGEKFRAYNHIIQSHGHDIYLLHGDDLFSLDLRFHVWQKDSLPTMSSTVFGENPSSDQHSRCYVDHEGTVWVYSFFSEHIYFKPGRNSKWQRLILDSSYPTNQNKPDNAIRNISQSPDGKIWIATSRRGLFCCDKTTLQTEHICDGNINCLLPDNKGTIWIGYYKSGIRYLHYHQDKPSRAEICGDITSLYVDDDGTRWIGTDGNGLWKELADGSLERTDLPSYTITDLRRSPIDGSLWIGTYNHGLFQRRNDGTTVSYNNTDGSTPHNIVQRLTIDKRGKVWVSANFGDFYCLDPATKTYKTVRDKSGESLLGIALQYDSARNKVLMGSYYGIWEQDIDGAGRRILGVRNDSIPFYEATILSIKIDEARPLIWLGHRQGITAWDLQADTLYSLTKDEGLMDNHVQSIIQDQDYRIWVSTVRGLSTIEALRDIDGQWEFSIRSFPASADSYHKTFNANSAAITDDGNLLLGTSQGYVIYDMTELLSSDANIPVAHITSISSGGKFIKLSPEIRLKSEQQPITVSLYTGNPLDAENVKFSYNLEGLNDSWIQTHERTINLLSLPVGQYRLRVKASYPGNEWGQEDSVRLIIEPPFLLSSGMIAVYIVSSMALILLVFLVLRWRQQLKAIAVEQEMKRDQQIQLAEMKLQFFTNVSHDLRTPLTLIISPLQKLLSQNLPQEVHKSLEMIDNNAHQLLNQITTLLDFRKIDSGSESLILCTPQNIVLFIREQCDAFYTLASSRNIKISISSTVNSITMAFDVDKIRKIVYNIMSNAIKYSPDNSVIHVLIENKDNDCIVKIADQGPGIPADQQEKVFSRFYQIAASHSQPGSGIGLHIVNQYVKMHGGRVWIEDNKPHGAVFCFNIPVSDSATVKDPERPPLNPSISQSDKFCILIVDDNTDLCQFISESLRDRYYVICANDGIEALEKIQAHDVHLVVSDVMMPRMDGLELCNTIKSRIEWSHIPVLLLTAKTANQSVLEGLQQGADDYLTKPFDIEILQLRINKFIEWEQRCQSHFDLHRDKSIVKEITITHIDEEFVKKAISLVEENIADAKFGVEELCSALCMSRSNLYKKLCAITGKSTFDFIRSIRMKKAQQMIINCDMRISEIAYSVGYNSLKTFTENFKQEFGVTPTEYRSKM